VHRSIDYPVAFIISIIIITIRVHVHVFVFVCVCVCVCVCTCTYLSTLHFFFSSGSVGPTRRRLYCIHICIHTHISHLHISSVMAFYTCGGIYWTHLQAFESRAQRERAGTPVAPGCVEHVHQRQQYLRRNSTSVRENIKQQKLKDFRGFLKRIHAVSNSIPPPPAPSSQTSAQ
jgi:hypothetical protein